jgi:hypothetical protein
MATTTTNFGWDIPQSTDLVKDGATAIAALGQDIDTALVDLKGGTTGQVLTKASNTDLDFSFTTLSVTSGLNLIANQTVTSSTTVNVNNVFSSTYDNYLVVGTLTSSGAQNGDIRMRVSGSDNSTANSYVYEKINADNTSLTASRTTSDKWTGILFAGPNIASQRLNFYRPFVAAQTGIDGVSSVEGNYLLLSGGLHNQSTSYTGFTLLYGSAV